MGNRSENRKDPHKRRWLLLLIPVLVLGVVILINSLNKEEVRNSIPEELTPVMTYEILNVYPHDPQAFTQGLVYREGYLYESTGLYGESSLRQVDLESGEVLQQLDLPTEFFAEGLASYADRLIQLTWREGTGFVYDLNDFSLIDRFTYTTEGWGLTHDGKQLIMSDGTSHLYLLDPETRQVKETLDVSFQDEEIVRLNELEYIRGEIYANIWQTDAIVRIDPATGEVMGWIDLGGILPDELHAPGTDVLNGIAYDPENDRLFITGKRWPRLYEIRLLPSTLPYPVY